MGVRPFAMVVLAQPCLLQFVGPVRILLLHLSRCRHRFPSKALTYRLFGASKASMKRNCAWLAVAAGELRLAANV